MEDEIWIQRDDLKLDCVRALISDNVLLLHEHFFSGCHPTLADLVDNASIAYWTAWLVPPESGTPQDASLLDIDPPRGTNPSPLRRELEAKGKLYKIVKDAITGHQAIVNEEFASASSRPGSTLAGVVAVGKKAPGVCNLQLIHVKYSWRRRKIATRLLQYARYKTGEAGFKIMVAGHGICQHSDPLHRLLLRSNLQVAVKAPCAVAGEYAQAAVGLVSPLRPPRGEFLEIEPKIAAERAAAEEEELERLGALRRQTTTLSSSVDGESNSDREASPASSAASITSSDDGSPCGNPGCQSCYPVESDTPGERADS